MVQIDVKCNKEFCYITKVTDILIRGAIDFLGQRLFAAYSPVKKQYIHTYLLGLSVTQKN